MRRFIQAADMFWRRKAPSRISEGVTCIEASSEKCEDTHCDQILTSNVDETWNSGQKAPGWVEFDLGKSYNLTHMKLLPYQVPTPANTRHKVYVGSSREDLKLATELNSETKHHVWTDDVAVNKKNVRFVRVETVDSPSWVAWSGMQFYGR